MDDSRRLLMQILEPSQDLDTPALDDPKSRDFIFFDVLEQATTSKHMRNENDFFHFLIVPCWNELDDILVI